MRSFSFFIMVAMTLGLKAYSQEQQKILVDQYPFEKYKAIKYKSYNDWKTVDIKNSENKVQNTITIPGVFDNNDSLTIQLTSYQDHWWTNSVIQLSRNNNLIQKIDEDIAFEPVDIDSIWVADINGDGLQDIKLVISYLENGPAAMDADVIYLFQRPDHKFIKISYSDKMDGNRPERDFAGDGSFEIITMNIIELENKNYLLFNLYKYKNEKLVNVNSKYNYPEMMQYFYRDNFEIPKKISRQTVKGLALTLPVDYDRKK